MTPVQSEPIKPGLSRTERLLAGILAALVMLVASVLAVAATIYIVTRPVPAPTGPTVQVSIDVSVTDASATASLADASGASTVQLGAMALGPADRRSWNRPVPFGSSIEVTVMVSALYTNDEGVEDGHANCIILDDKDVTLAKAEVTVVNGVGSCKWTNNGK